MNAQVISPSAPPCPACSSRRAKPNSMKRTTLRTLALLGAIPAAIAVAFVVSLAVWGSCLADDPFAWAFLAGLIPAIALIVLANRIPKAWVCQDCRCTWAR